MRAVHEVAQGMVYAQGGKVDDSIYRHLASSAQEAEDWITEAWVKRRERESMQRRGWTG